MKIFIQMINILRWNLKENQTYMKQIKEMEKNMGKKITELRRRSNVSSFVHMFVDKQDQNAGDKENYAMMSGNGKNSNNTSRKIMKRNSQNITLLKSRFINDNGFEKNSIQSSKQSELSFIKQKIPLQLREIDQQIERIQKQFKGQTYIKKLQDQQNQQLFEKLQSNQQYNQNLKVSNNEQVLNEIIVHLHQKGEAIERFAKIRAHCIQENMLMQENSQKYYQKISSDVNGEMKLNFQHAKSRLASLFREQIYQYEMEKMTKIMQNARTASCQVNQDDIDRAFENVNDKANSEKFKDKILIKKLRTQLIQLSYQLQYERKMKQSMQKLISQKSSFFQSQKLKYRNQLISLQVKAKRQTQTLNNIKNKQYNNQIKNIQQNQNKQNDNNDNSEHKKTDSIDFLKQTQDIRDDCISIQDDKQVRSIITFVSRKYIRNKTNKKLYTMGGENFIIDSRVWEVNILHENHNLKNFGTQTVAEGPPSFSQSKRTKKVSIPQKIVDYNKTQILNGSSLISVKRKSIGPMLKNIQFSLQNFQSTPTNFTQRFTSSSRVTSANRSRDHKMNNRSNKNSKKKNLIDEKSMQSRLIERIMEKYDIVENEKVTKEKFNLLKMNHNNIRVDLRKKKDVKNSMTARQHVGSEIMSNQSEYSGFRVPDSAKEMNHTVEFSSNFYNSDKRDFIPLQIDLKNDSQMEFVEEMVKEMTSKRVIQHE